MVKTIKLEWEKTKLTWLKIVILVAIIAEIIWYLPDIFQFKVESLITPFVLTILLVLFERSLSIEQSVENLAEGLKNNPDIEEYSTISDFQRILDQIEKFENITVIGEFPHSDFDFIKKIIGKTGKKVAIFRHLNRKYIDDVRNEMDFDKLLKTRKIEIFHMNNIMENFIIIGQDHTKSHVKILINSTHNQKENSISGHFFKGKTAIILTNFFLSMIDHSKDRSMYSVESLDAADYVISHGLIYAAKINRLYGGVPKEGVKAICDTMSNVLKNSNQTMDVTHVSNRKNIDLPQDEFFKNWVEVNYAAAKRNVNIRRIFIVPSADMKYPKLLHTMDEMKKNGIDVRIVAIETLQRQDIAIKDFSIYDGEHLVYIHHEEDTGGWFMDKEDIPTAKHSTNPDLINQYQTLFNAMYNHSLPYESSKSG